MPPDKFIEDTPSIVTMIDLDIDPIYRAKHLLVLCEGNRDYFKAMCDLLGEESQSVLTHFINLYHENWSKPQILGPRISEASRKEELAKPQPDQFEINEKADSELSKKVVKAEFKARADQVIMECQIEDSDSDKAKEILTSKEPRSELAKHLLYCSVSGNFKYHADDALKELVKRIVGDDYVCKTRVGMTPKDSGQLNEYTADVMIEHIGSMLSGMAIMIDRSCAEHDVVQKDTVKVALGMVLKNKWKNGKPLYIIRLVGTNVVFYKTNFTEKQMSRLRAGEKLASPLLMIKYLPAGYSRGANNVQHYNLMSRYGREKIIKILSVITSEIDDNVSHISK
ncbi:hypothetical protein Unana1_00175 [Umbelopsis nana]